MNLLAAGVNPLHLISADSSQLLRFQIDPRKSYFEEFSEHYSPRDAG